MDDAGDQPTLDEAAVIGHGEQKAQLVAGERLDRTERLGGGEDELGDAVGANDPGQQAWRGGELGLQRWRAARRDRWRSARGRR
jgi:hypothetical protein